MSDIATINPTTPTASRPRQRVPEIQLPGGDVLVPRADFVSKLGVCERTAKRWDLPTTYIGGVAFVQRDASLRIIASTVHRRNQPTPRRRAPRRVIHEKEVA